MKRNKRRNSVEAAFVLIFVSGAVVGGATVAAAPVLVARFVPKSLAVITTETKGGQVRTGSAPVAVKYTVTDAQATTEPITFRAAKYTVTDAQATTEPITFRADPAKYAGKVVLLEWCHLVRQEGQTLTLNPGVVARLHPDSPAPDTVHYFKLIGRVDGDRLVDCQVLR